MLSKLAGGLAVLLLLAAGAAAQPGTGNRLTYLDENDPYHVGRRFPKLTTPQWVGEPGVEAVVILSIDDMRDPARYESYLRPILNRLKQIDGRAPVSILTNTIQPDDPRLQAWLKEGLSLDCHTIDHPCPCLAGDFAKARSTYGRCVDLLAAVPGSRPVAFRMPCCDSLNTPSPRFYAEIFNQTTEAKRFLTIDSSVFNLFTANDPELPRGLVLDEAGRERFRKYLPADRSFVNTIEDYPYPYVLGRLCWEFPCVTPSDWQAQHLHKPFNPQTVRDWKAALDATVKKQGVFPLVFHPHGWIKSEQIVELIDHAVATHGKKVKFLNFREAQERLDRHLLRGQPLRDPKTGGDNGVRLLDLNGDGCMDVLIGNDQLQATRLWLPAKQEWIDSPFPSTFISGGRATGVRFGVIRGTQPSFIATSEMDKEAWTFDGTKWAADPKLLAGLELNGKPVFTAMHGRDYGVRFRDLDGDGRCEAFICNTERQAAFAWEAARERWTKLPFAFPRGARLVDVPFAGDLGLRFVDIDEDGRDDLIWSNEFDFGLSLFTSLEKGWSRQIMAGKPGEPGALPLISKNGTNHGVWFHSRHLWAQNEQTSMLKDHVDRRSFNQLLAQVEPTAKTAAASLRCLQPRPGFTVELMAAEPLVQDPIGFAWGPDGKLWVVEMGDYPTGTDGKGKSGGRIKILESTKGDGKYDKATLFLDGLPYPTSVLPWRKGVLVTAAPEIFYAEDTDGDGKADQREPLFVGFFAGNPQHRVNTLAWGLDNWIYAANGDSGGIVRSVKTGKSVLLRGRDLRIRPDTGEMELVAGQTQHGRSRDDWGHWFGGTNSYPMWHFALEDRYLRRNRRFAAPDGKVHLGAPPGAAPVYPISRTLRRFNDPHMANCVTSACSPMVYRDELFGPAFAGNTFYSEPVHNLVHREIMAPRGVSFASRRAADEQRSEFLASSDNWFRPTSLATGPDGALWIADMHRAVIEHPDWIPKETQQRIDLRAGHDLGRLYRVFPVGAQPRPIPRLDRLDTAGLVAALDSPSGWQRDLAQQMLLWRNDANAVPLLEAMAEKNARPLARLHALCTLDGLGRLKPRLVKAGLHDPHPGVRRHAVRLSEPLLSLVWDAALLDDPDPQVRMQVAYALGQWTEPHAAPGAGALLGRLALRDGGDPLFLAAVMSSVNDANLESMAIAVVGAGNRPPAGLMENLLKMAHALGKTETLASLLGVIANSDQGSPSWRFQVLACLLDSLDESGQSLEKLAEMRTIRTSLKELEALFSMARTVASDEQAAQADRLLAVRLLGRGLGHQAEDRSQLARLLGPRTSDELQTAALAALGRLRGGASVQAMLRAWRGLSPARRSQVLDLLLAREEGTEAALAALELKEIPLAEIGAAHRQRFLERRSDALRGRAAALFAGSLSQDRQKVIDSYRSVEKLTGDPAARQAHLREAMRKLPSARRGGT